MAQRSRKALKEHLQGVVKAGLLADAAPHHGGYVKVWNALVLEWGGALAPYSRLGGTCTRCIQKGSRRSGTIPVVSPERIHIVPLDHLASGMCGRRVSPNH